MEYYCYSLIKSYNAFIFITIEYKKGIKKTQRRFRMKKNEPSILDPQIFIPFKD